MRFFWLRNIRLFTAILPKTLDGKNFGQGPEGAAALLQLLALLGEGSLPWPGYMKPISRIYLSPRPRLISSPCARPDRQNSAWIYFIEIQTVFCKTLISKNRNSNKHRPYKQSRENTGGALEENMSSYTGTNPTGSDLGARETQSLIAASKVNGTSVYNASGESLGTIHDVMLNKRSGQVTYAVLSFGGFLGIGEKYHPLPWDKLTYSEQHGGYVVNLSKDVLQNSPAYASSETPDWSTPAYGNSVDDYYRRTLLP
jgi:sporulation protein YlmC with PRC-barrel domain